ncbi:MAG: hypothetical protein ACOX50_00465 [Patescibacteria group bacterium]|jgi:hypothetical protein
MKIAQEIIYPFSSEYPKIVTTTSAMREFTNHTLCSLKQMYDGDPYLGLPYSLSAGENPSSTPVYGIGIIDPKGLFPKLYEFLHKENRLQEIIEIMEPCDYGVAKLGWSTFVSYLYEQTGRNLRQVDELLCPVFCSNDIFPTLVDNRIRKALAKLYSIPQRDPHTGTFPATSRIT